MKYLYPFLILVFLFACKTTSSTTITSNDVELSDDENTESKSSVEEYTITPVEHATAVIEFGEKTLYIDPVGGMKLFKDFDQADVVFVTHGHGDHLSVKTIENIKSNETVFVVPQSVADAMPEELNDKIIVMANGETGEVMDIPVDAIAMYNIREEAKNFHPKGDGNGYVITLNEDKIYFSGDTEGTPEMKSLTDIDKAFVCMNMPFTMPVDKAAEAVLAFQPKEAYPYHYRGRGGLSDVDEFKRLVEEGSDNIEVIQWNWYPSSK